MWRRGAPRMDSHDPVVCRRLWKRMRSSTSASRTMALNRFVTRPGLIRFPRRSTNDPYQLQKPTAAGIERAERFEKLADRVADLWSTLKRGTSPLTFEPQERHWGTLRQHFAPVHRIVQERGYSHLVSVPRRAGLWTFRIAMLLTVLRAHDEGAPLQRLDTVEARDEDVTAAVRIAEVYADHALRFARAKLADGQPQSPRDRRIAAMLATVDEQFSSGEAYAAAKAAGFDVSTRTLRRDLKAAEKRGLIESTTKTGGWNVVGPPCPDVRRVRIGEGSVNLHRSFAGADTTDMADTPRK